MTYQEQEELKYQEVEDFYQWQFSHMEYLDLCVFDSGKYEYMDYYIKKHLEAKHRDMIKKAIKELCRKAMNQGEINEGCTALNMDFEDWAKKNIK